MGVWQTKDGKERSKVVGKRPVASPASPRSETFTDSIALGVEMCIILTTFGSLWSCVVVWVVEGDEREEGLEPFFTRRRILRFSKLSVV